MSKSSGSAVCLLCPCGEGAERPQLSLLCPDLIKDVSRRISLTPAFMLFIFLKVGSRPCNGVASQQQTGPDHTRTHAHTHTQTHTHTHTRRHADTHTRTHAHTHTHTRTHADTHTHTHAHTQT